MFDTDPLPDKLYKYKSFDSSGFYHDLISKNILYFASPHKFNDPYDCMVFPNYQIGSDDQIFSRFLAHIKNEKPSLPSQIQEHIARINFRKNIKILRDPGKFRKRMTSIVSSSFGVFSLSEKNDNLLMWAHYGLNHTGFCVEFDAPRLREIANNYIKINELIYLAKINYEIAYPEIDPYKVDYDLKDFLKWITTKSKDWEYEQEWRLIYSQHPNESLDFPADIITGIYFGSRCDDENINSVSQLIQSKTQKPQLYKAELKHRAFGITFKNLRI